MYWVVFFEGEKEDSQKILIKIAEKIDVPMEYFEDITTEIYWDDRHTYKTEFSLDKTYTEIEEKTKNIANEWSLNGDLNRYLTSNMMEENVIHVDNVIMVIVYF